MNVIYCLREEPDSSRWRVPSTLPTYRKLSTCILEVSFVSRSVCSVVLAPEQTEQPFVLLCSVCSVVLAAEQTEHLLIGRGGLTGLSILGPMIGRGASAPHGPPSGPCARGITLGA